MAAIRAILGGARRGGRTDPASKVVDVTSQQAICDTHQRKVFYDGIRFFVIYTPNYDVKTRYTSSLDGKTWASTTQLLPWYVAPGVVLSGFQPDIAFRFGSNTTLDVSWIDSGSSVDWYPVTISNGILSLGSGTSLAAGGAVGISLCPNLDGNNYSPYYRPAGAYVVKNPLAKVTYVACPGYGTSNGGFQLLSYKSSSPYNMLLIIKKNDNTLHYAIVAPVDGTWPSIGAITSMSLTLASGFNSYCGCSPVQAAGDSELCHLIYIKATGELCYKKYEGDAWSSETVLVESGASYPVIACGAIGRLYVFYVADGKIMMLEYDGSSWLAQEQPFPGHNYQTPTYLSSNQNVQDGKICLVWVEGTESPYEVWFCSLEEPTFTPSGLAPQETVEVDGADPTRDTYQRKIFFDGTTFFIVYWDLGDKKVYYVVSVDGENWGSKVELWEFGVAPYYGGNIDIGYPNRGTVDTESDPVDLAMHFTGSNGASSSWRPFTISNQILTEGGAATLAADAAQGDSIVPNLNGSYDYMIYHRDGPDHIYIHRSAAVRSEDYDSSVSHGGTSTGGCQLLPYKTSSPYNMLALAKGGDDKLYYNIVSVATPGVPVFVEDTFTEIATLGTGFSDFCACSEAQDAGDPEKIHLVYIKSTGQLCYRKYENDAWSSEKVLVGSGASYPVIAAGSNGKLYVFYVSGGKIHVIHNDGNWLTPVELFTADHTYNTPVYLSCNQNVQNEKICLVWCEGTETPWAIWFCYLED